MGETKHTPGPWHVGDLDKNYQRIVCGEHIEIATCWHHCVGSIEREMEANARLIAAAPDLLEACRYIVEAGETGDEMLAIENARAAIAKATGEGMQ